MTDRLAPTTPGEVLLKEFLRPLGITQYRLAAEISVPTTAVEDIVDGRGDITADMASKLAGYFGTSDQFWLNLQRRYDLV